MEPRHLGGYISGIKIQKRGRGRRRGSGRRSWSIKGPGVWSLVTSAAAFEFFFDAGGGFPAEEVIGVIEHGHVFGFGHFAVHVLFLEREGFLLGTLIGVLPNDESFAAEAREGVE